MEKERRPLREAATVAADLVGRLRPFCVRAEVAGSVRRRKDTVKDIEVVAIPRRGDAPADLFGHQEDGERPNLLWSALDAEGVRYQKRGNLYRRFTWRGWDVDLFTASIETWGWIFLIRTGSRDFSHGMAKRLNAAGLTSEGGWIKDRRTGRSLPTPGEEDVFALAGMPWVPPECREQWTDEAVTARAGAGP